VAASNWEAATLRLRRQEFSFKPVQKNAKAQPVDPSAARVRLNSFGPYLRGE